MIVPKILSKSYFLKVSHLTYQRIGLTCTVAVRDSNLMNLLLAYSASHRARLLKHPEPANRIAVWVRDVFPTLRHALEAADGPMSSSNLATAIMLASLEIVSPDTFELSVSWQTHLNIARKMIVARGGPRFTHERDKVSCFLSRWFAYLDVLGSLSGGKNDQLISSGDYWTRDNELDEENDFQIDCLLGFTSRCVCILAKIAELARVCDTERIDASRNMDPAWIGLDAAALFSVLERTRTQGEHGDCIDICAALAALQPKYECKSSGRAVASATTMH